MAKPRTVVGKKRIMVNYEGTKEILTNIFEYKDLKEVRVDFDESCVKILTKNSKEYEIIFEDTNKEQLVQFQRFLITSMSGITQDEILKAREMAQKAQAAAQKIATSKAKDTKKK